ncbi:hypothetical protein DAMA08_048150 [Martiniozyma asiatica (nom. inval.)]|nr:hypothetical protein DAMA08_048150 [Martiniozyma asiatica]
MGKIQSNPLFQALNAGGNGHSNLKSSKRTSHGKLLSKNPLAKRLAGVASKEGRTGASAHSNTTAKSAINKVKRSNNNHQQQFKLRSRDRITNKPRDRANNKISTVVSQKIQRAKETYSFKNASHIPFLRVKNLDEAVSETDISLIMSEFGVIVKILTTAGRSKGDSTITAEIFYVEDESLKAAQGELDGRRADGRILDVSIDTQSEIINSDRLWKEVLEEVRFHKHEFLKKRVNNKSALLANKLYM